MQKILIGLDILLMLIDLIVFMRFRKILKEHSKGDEFVIPKKVILPYVIIMLVISILIPVIGFCMQLL